MSDYLIFDPGQSWSRGWTPRRGWYASYWGGGNNNVETLKFYLKILFRSLQTQYCTNVQMCNRTRSKNVQKYKCKNVQMYKSLQMYNLTSSTNVQMYQCTNVQIYIRATVPPFLYITKAVLSINKLHTQQNLFLSRNRYWIILPWL